jgi:hypothetical protein
LRAEWYDELPLWFAITLDSTWWDRLSCCFGDGRRLGLSRNAVYIARSRVLARLREVLRGIIDDEAIQ